MVKKQRTGEAIAEIVSSRTQFFESGFDKAGWHR
jgi:hypothetical protein